MNPVAAFAQLNGRKGTIRLFIAVVSNLSAGCALEHPYLLYDRRSQEASTNDKPESHRSEYLGRSLAFFRFNLAS